MPLTESWQVALLSGMVGPRVAAAAAQAAVAAIAEDEPGVSELPFMQSPKLTSKHRRHASQTFQNHSDGYKQSFSCATSCVVFILSLYKSQLHSEIEMH